MAEEVTMLSNLREPVYGQGQTPQLHQTPRVEQTKLPPMGNFAPTPTATTKDNKRKRGSDRQPTGGNTSAMATMTDTGPSVGARGGPGSAGNVNKVCFLLHYSSCVACPSVTMIGARTNRVRDQVFRGQPAIEQVYALGPYESEKRRSFGSGLTSHVPSHNTGTIGF